jgi:DNA helicase II / ATP-dependent DNA helicase PcrA
MMPDDEYRIFGPPGTGKTTYLARNIRNAVVKHGSDSVIVASFTKAAAAELVKKDLPVGRDRIDTLHAHAYHALGMPPVAESNLKAWNEAHPGWPMTPKKTGLDEPNLEANASTQADLHYLVYQRQRALMRDIRALPIDTRGWIDAWEAWKRETGAVDFTDMIEIAYRDVDQAPGAPSIGFFDEVQDFTLLELSLVRKWGVAMDFLLLAGDDDQCIYAFKGATPNAFLHPPIPASHKKVLSQSYRVPRSVHALSQAWVADLTHREPKAYAPRDDDGELRILRSAHILSPETAILEAERYTRDGASVMFLTSCGYMLDRLQTVLRASHIPFHNPYRRARRDWNPLHASTGTSTAKRVLAYLRPDRRVWGDGARIWTVGDLRDWLGLIKITGVLRRGAKAELEKRDKDERLDGAQLSTLFEEEAYRAVMRCDLNWLAGKLTAEKTRTALFPIGIAIQRGGRALMDEPKITIGTIHSVKGGEADVVYLFPDLSTSGWEEYGSDEPLDRDSVIRQFYVGMTRAKRALILPRPAYSWAVDLLDLAGDHEARPVEVVTRPAEEYEEVI